MNRFAQPMSVKPLKRSPTSPVKFVTSSLGWNGIQQYKGELRCLNCLGVLDKFGGTCQRLFSGNSCRGHTFTTCLAPDTAHERRSNVEVEFEVFRHSLKHLVLVPAPLLCAIGERGHCRHRLVLERRRLQGKKKGQIISGWLAGGITKPLSAPSAAEKRR